MFRPSTFLTILTLAQVTGMCLAQERHEFTLNGLEIALDARTGGLLSLRYEGPGPLLEAAPGDASLLDLAYPRPDFEPLRLGARYSSGVEVTRQERSVLIAWLALGASRDLPLSGSVSAAVRLREDEDGRSVVLSCEVANRSDRPVRQVVFPDLNGLLPVAGPDETIFKTGGCGNAPFRELRLSESDQFYATDGSYRQYTSGGMFSEMWMRWMDLGGLNGGFSLFPRTWGWEPRATVLLHLSPATEQLRLMCLRDVTLEPGQTWRSEEWVLTPHRQGWAKGIEVYRDFVRSRIQRTEPLPEHIRTGLGFRTVWMCRNQPNDPAGDAVYRFEDLPAVAEEAKAHGLTEMVMWSTHHGFTLPLPVPFPHLGTEQDLVDAVRRCRELGVNCAPFISVLQANRATGARYGLSVPESGGWTYHPEMIPRFNPPYAGQYACAQVDTANPQWQADVLEFTRHLADSGIPSVAWDQFWANEREPNIATLTAQIREHARALDPQSTFSGEELFNIEIDCEHLDYTWNWGGYGDFQAYTSVFPSPRRNLNINHSVWEVKRGFLDGLYLNVWPTRPGDVNGSDSIRNHPDLSRALKQCAALRAQFSPYFTEGAFIGGCLLTRSCPGTHCAARVLDDRLLFLVTNEGEARSLTLDYDAAPWLATPATGLRLLAYDADGSLLSEERVRSGPSTLTTPVMDRLETRAWELTR